MTNKSLGSTFDGHINFVNLCRSGPGPNSTHAGLCRKRIAYWNHGRYPRYLLGRCSQRRRPSGIRRAVPPTFKTNSPGDSTDNPEEACILNALENECVRAIRYLSPTLRVVVQIRYREDASIAQIAKMLGISEAAVKSRLLRARLKIRAHLEQRQYLSCGIDPKALGGCSNVCRIYRSGAA